MGEGEIRGGNALLFLHSFAFLCRSWSLPTPLGSAHRVHAIYPCQQLHHQSVISSSPMPLPWSSMGVGGRKCLCLKSLIIYLLEGEVRERNLAFFIAYFYISLLRVHNQGEIEGGHGLALTSYILCPLTICVCDDSDSHSGGGEISHTYAWELANGRWCPLEKPSIFLFGSACLPADDDIIIHLYNKWDGDDNDDDVMTVRHLSSAIFGLGEISGSGWVGGGYWWRVFPSILLIPSPSFPMKIIKSLHLPIIQILINHIYIILSLGEDNNQTREDY